MGLEALGEYEPRLGLNHMYLAGLITGIVYSLLYDPSILLKLGIYYVFLQPSFMAISQFLHMVSLVNNMVEYTLWFIVVFWSVILFLKGIDYRRIMFSFSLSFLTIISFIYVFFILVLNIPGYPRGAAFFLTPILVIASLGYVRDKLITLKEARKRTKVKVSLSKRVRTTVYKLDPIMWVFIITGFSILLIFLLTPVLLMLYHAFEVPPGESIFYNFVRIFTNRKYVRLQIFPWETFAHPEKIGGKTVYVITGINYGILLNSLINAAVVTTTATFLGIIVAFVLARYNFPGRNVFRVLAMIPLFVTPFVNAYVIKILFSDQGPISLITQALFGWGVRIDKLAGVALAQIMAFYPIVYLNAYSSFINIDPSMEEQAENLGSKGLKLFLTVTLPLALPGIVAGSILVFIFSLEDLGAPIVFQEERLMSYQIYSSFTSETGIVSPEIAALGFVMLFLASLGFLAIRSYVGMRSYAMVSRGGRWVLRERKLGWKGLLAVYLVLLPLIIFTALPQIGVILLAFNILPPYGFAFNFDKATPKYFIALFRDPTIFVYIRNTLTYASVAVLFATFVAIMIAYSVSRVKIRVLTPTMDTLATIPLAIPGLVIALGYFYFYQAIPYAMAAMSVYTIQGIGQYITLSGMGAALGKSLFSLAGAFYRPIYEFLFPISPVSGPTTFQAWIVLIIAYSIRKLPFVVRSVFAGFQQVHHSLEEAALNLGASRSRVIFGVILPFIVTYIISGAIVGFIYISTEVSTSITIGGLRPDQAPMTFEMMMAYKGTTTYGVQLAAAMGVLLILFQLIAILIIVLGFKQRYAFIGV